ncbi:MAG TPA: hypothetical protein VF503_31355 [Sphingobium sp.]
MSDEIAPNIGLLVRMRGSITMNAALCPADKQGRAAKKEGA